MANLGFFCLLELLVCGLAHVGICCYSVDEEHVCSFVHGGDFLWLFVLFLWGAKLWLPLCLGISMWRQS